MRLATTSTRYTAQSTRDERLSQKIGATSYGDDSAANTTGISFPFLYVFALFGLTNCQTMEANGAQCPSNAVPYM